MTLSVDASVVAKWFVKEQGFEEARGLLAHRIHLHAPDILLAEFANTIWKKVHRREVADPRPYFDELVNLPEIVTLHRGDALIDRAAEIAAEIDHPVYDCLYLACAEVTASALITADRRFAKKLAGRIPDVWHLEDPAAAGRIEAAATAVVISREKIYELVAAYETYAATEQFVVDSIPKSGNLKILTPEDRAPFPDSPANLRLVGLVGDLSDEERVDLLAIGWFGAGRFPSWRRSLEHASKMALSVDHDYTAGYGHHWRRGYELVTSTRPAHAP